MEPLINFSINNMKYLTLLFPALTAAVSINYHDQELLDIHDVNFPKEHGSRWVNGEILPHNVRPVSPPNIKKRDNYYKKPKFDVLDKEIKVESYKTFDAKKFEKASPILEICRKDIHNIQTKQELYNLQVQCETVMGSIHITNFDGPVVNLGNIEVIEGNFIIEDSSEIVGIEGRILERVGGTFSLQSLTSLVSLDIPLLYAVKVIDWKVVPILNTVLLSSEIDDIKSIIISDTSLSVIDGFDKIEEIDVFNINNNRFLEIIKTNIKEVKQQFTIHANAKEMELEMPELQYAENITVRDTSKVSMPNLEKVSSSMEFIENLFVDLELPKLTAVGGTLGIIENSNLKNVDLGSVSTIKGGLMISNNNKLESLDFLPKLKQIGGAIYFEGRFQDTEFPDLKLVKGSAYINTNSEQLDCNKWTTPISGRSIIRGGKINCTSGRKQKSISVNEDGEVIDGSEVTNEVQGEVHSSDKKGFFSRVSNDSAISKISNFVLWSSYIVLGTLCVTTILY